MSTEKPTTPKDDTTAPSPTDYWREKEALAGGASDAEVETSQVESKNTEGEGRKRALTRHARIIAAVVLAVLVVALAWVVVPVLVGGGSTPPRPRPASGILPAKERRTDGRGSGRTRWVREPGEPNESTRSPQRHAVLGAPRERHRARLRHPSPQPASPESDAPSQSLESGTAPPEPVPEAGEPEPKGKPGLRDGATESTEFGL